MCAVVAVGVTDFWGDIEDTAISISKALAGDREVARGVARSSENLADLASRP